MIILPTHATTKGLAGAAAGAAASFPFLHSCIVYVYQYIESGNPGQITLVLGSAGLWYTDIRLAMLEANMQAKIGRGGGGSKRLPLLSRCVQNKLRRGETFLLVQGADTSWGVSIFIARLDRGMLQTTTGSFILCSLQSCVCTFG